MNARAEDESGAGRPPWQSRVRPQQSSIVQMLCAGAGVYPDEESKTVIISRPYTSGPN